MKIFFANPKRGGLAAYYLFYAAIGLSIGILVLPSILEGMAARSGLGFNKETIFLGIGILFLLGFILHSLQVAIWGGLGIDIVEINLTEVTVRRKYRRQKWQMRRYILKVPLREVKKFNLREELDNILILQHYRFPEVEGYNIELEFENNHGGAFGSGQDAVFGKKMPKERALKKAEQLNKYVRELKKTL